MSDAAAAPDRMDRFYRGVRAHRPLLAVVLLQARRRAPPRARARRRARAPLRQPSEQPDRLAARGRRPPPQGPLPGHRRAVPQPAGGALPRRLRRHPRLSQAGRSRPRWTATPTPSRPASEPSRAGGSWHLSGGHHARRERACSGSRPAPPASRWTTRPSARGEPLDPDPGRPLLRGAQVVPQPRAASPSASRSGRPPTWRPTARTRSRRWTPSPPRSSGRWRRRSSTSSASTTQRPRPRRRGALPRRADPRSSWSERGLGRRADRPRAAVALDRRRRRATSRRASPSASSALWQRIQAYRVAARRVPRARRGGAAPRGERLPARARLVYSWDAIVGLPLFAYGALVNALPYYVPRWLAHRMARKETDYATIRLLASVVAFPLFWGLETWLVCARGRGRAGRWPLRSRCRSAGAIAYRYLIGAGWLRVRLRFARSRRHPGPGAPGGWSPSARPSSPSSSGPRTTTSRPRKGAAFERSSTGRDVHAGPRRARSRADRRAADREPAGGARAAPAASASTRSRPATSPRRSPSGSWRRGPAGRPCCCRRCTSARSRSRRWARSACASASCATSIVDYGERAGPQRLPLRSHRQRPRRPRPPRPRSTRRAATVSRRHGVMMASFTGHLAWEFLRGRYVDADRGRARTRAHRRRARRLRGRCARRLVGNVADAAAAPRPGRRVVPHAAARTLLAGPAHRPQLSA